MVTLDTTRALQRSFFSGFDFSSFSILVMIVTITNGEHEPQQKLFYFHTICKTKKWALVNPQHPKQSEKKR